MEVLLHRPHTFNPSTPCVVLCVILCCLLSCRSRLAIGVRLCLLGGGWFSFCNAEKTKACLVCSAKMDCALQHTFNADAAGFSR
jgi:hypothetical protein